MKKLLALLLSALMCFCLAGCDSLFVKHVPPSYASRAIYYGVAQTIEESDVLIMEFNKDVQIWERYPAEFSIPADSMRAVEFSFSLTWGTYGISSYDSTTGCLLKTNDASNKKDYETTHFLTAHEKATIFTIIEDLHPHTYPDEYNPTEGKGSTPYQKLILSVEIEDDIPKTITAEQVALDEATSPEGKRFMDTCKKIADILKNTDEWKALPDYPYLYD